MNDYKAVGGLIGTTLSAIGAGLSITEIQAIVSIIATVIGLIITIVSTVVIPLIKKIKEANKDGKITADEAIDILEDTTNNLEAVKKDLDNDKK